MPYMVINISDTHFSKRAAHKQRNSLIKPINPRGKTYQTKLILAHIVITIRGLRYCSQLGFCKHENRVKRRCLGCVSSFYF